MPILREKQTWRRERTRAATDRIDRLSPEQQANVRRALGVLAIRYGSLAKVGAAMGVHAKAVTRAAGSRGRPTAGMALHVARLAGVPVEDVLTGAFPREGSCPMCGRGD